MDDDFGPSTKRPRTETSSNEPTKKKCRLQNHRKSHPDRDIRRNSGEDESSAEESGQEKVPSSRTSSTPPEAVKEHASAATPFSSHASIVLVGFRGAGKSTLAVIASRAHRRRVIDIDNAFHDATGQSGSSYRKKHGAAQHGLRYLQIMRSLFEAYENESILVCSMSSMEQNVQKYLQQYSKMHPVIHIVRDPQSIQSYLGISDEARFEKILNAAEEVMRSCSTFEFYNAPSQLSVLPDSDFHSGQKRTSATSNPTLSSPPFLALKSVEQHFLKLISLIFPGSAMYPMDSPVSSIPVHLRSWTYAASVPLSTFDQTPDLEAMTVGADALELVLDSRSPDSGNELAKALRSAISQIRGCSNPLPIIIHVDVDHSTYSLENYIRLLAQACSVLPEYLTFDLGQPGPENLTSLRSVFEKTQITLIGHFAMRDAGTTWQDGSLVQAYERARELGCKLVRFTRSVESYSMDSIDEAFAIRSFKRRVEHLSGPKLPIIAYTTLSHGRTSACFNKILTPVKVPELQGAPDPWNRHNGLVKNDPLITAQSATQALYSCFVFDRMQFYVIGASAGYSLSPAMHNAAYEALGLPHSYDIHQVPDLRGIQVTLQNEHFGGASISQPYKVGIMYYLGLLSQHARSIGAVNTILPVRRPNKNGRTSSIIELFAERNKAGPVKALYGENTDWIGMVSCISQGLSPANAVSRYTTGLIIGAGGMARAAVYAMVKMGVRTIYIFNRTKSNAQLLADHFRAHDVLDPSEVPEFCVLDTVDDPWPIQHHSYPTIVVSCVPTHAIGYSPAPYFTLPNQWMGSKTGGIVLELGYKTLNTPLLQQIRAMSRFNWVAMDGLDLLPEQGFAQFELFTGRRAPRRLMRAKVLECYMERMSEDDEARETVMRRLLRLKKE